MATRTDEEGTASLAGTTGSPALAEAFSFVLGLCSLLLGWTFFAPLVGLICGIYGVRKGRAAKKFAIWGIVLNSVALAGWVVVIAVVGISGVFLAVAPGS